MKRREVLRNLCGGWALSFARDPATRRSSGNAKPVDLEIIVSSLPDAIAAYEGGASRFEVAVRLDQGGLTPSLSLVESILRRVPIASRVMLREHSGFTLTGREELDKLKGDAEALSKLPLDGLITGHVRDGGLDLSALRQLTEAAPSTHFTVHNALEMTSDPLAALRALRNFPAVDGALVTGGKGSESERIAHLPDYELALGPNRRLILGGLHLKDITEVRRSTDISTFHLGTGVRTPENPLGKVDAEKVKKARRLLSSPKT
jgi:copper homeostasis protein